ncbi:hypothetical protein Lpl7_1802 [Lacticaseibacillus paracasei subsp. tolerans Lpl7]|nr:hypothetical protein Lpl7_1802 [Lacticaseibacillus paracasei subsp. tolerans Lpl7]
MNNNQERPLDFGQKSSDGLFDCQELREQGSPLCQRVTVQNCQTLT